MYNQYLYLLQGDPDDDDGKNPILLYKFNALTNYLSGCNAIECS